MKAKNLFGIALLFFCIINSTSCNDSIDDGWYDRIPDGGFFIRANTVRFYYIDENGSCLINPDNPNTFPVTWSDELENPAERTKDFDKENGNYNGNHNQIIYDDEEKLYYCTMSAYGDQRESTYSFPVYIKGETDKMEITYKYTDKGVIGGKYHSKIISWKYNGKHIYSDDDGLYKKVFVKKSKGTTTVFTK